MATQDQLKRSATWGPFWIQPIVFAAFAGIFTCIAIALVMILRYSLRHNGLFTAQPRFSYGWRFGPTAVLTLLSVLWSRVEMQTRIYTPWIVLCRGQPSDEVDFELDYTSMPPPITIIQAWKRRHFLVLVATIAGIFLKIQIVLAPSLFETAIVEFGQKVPIQLLDVFDPQGNNDAPPGFLVDTSPYYVARGYQLSGISEPFGVSTGLAYQRFEPRGKSGATVLVTVDALFVEMKCLKMTSASVIGQDHLNKSATHEFHVSLHFEGCGPFTTGPFEMEAWKNTTNLWKYNATFTPINPCPNLPQQNYQFIYFGGDFEKTNTTTGSHVALVEAYAVMCSLQTWISKVKVIDNGIAPRVEELPNTIRHPFEADIWAMIRETVPNGDGHVDWSRFSPISWPPGGPAQVLRNLRNEVTPEVLNTTILFDSVLALTDLLGPLVANYGLRQNRITEGEGQLFVNVVRLKINQSVCLTMLSVSVLLHLSALSQTRCKSVIWHRNPATLLGNMVFFQQYPNIRRQALWSCRTGKLISWSNCSFSPYVFENRIRLAFTIATCGVIATLIITLNVSEEHEGLASTTGYWSLLSTSFPTFVVLGVSLYASSCDSFWKGLISVHSVFTKPRNAHHLDISLQDMLGLRVLISSIKLDAWSISLSQIVSLACAFLTTIASVLFAVEIVPKRTHLQLRQASWFGDHLQSNSEDWRNRRAIGDLMFRKGERHVIYPKNTYDDLVLPLLSGIPSLGIESNSNVTIEATLPAATVSSTCEKIFTKQAVSRPYFTVPVTCPNGTSFDHAYGIPLDGAGPDTPDNKTYFANIAGDLNGPCSLPLGSNNAGTTDASSNPVEWVTYFWGYWDNAGNKSGFTTVWQCKYLWTQVMVSAHLVSDNGEVQIDQTIKPIPIDSTVTPYDPPFSLPVVSSFTYDLRLRRVLAYQARFHKTYLPIFKPHGKFALEAFGESEQERNILEALNYRRKFASAQVANFESRLFVGASSRSSSFPSDGLPLVSATLIENDTKRLVQSPIATYLLISLLGLVVLHNVLILCITVFRRYISQRVVKVFIMDTKGLAPESSGSIAGSASLLQETNVSKYLATIPSDLPAERLAARLKGVRLRMGWFQREPEKSQHFTIGVMNDEEFVFVGGKNLAKRKTSNGEKSRATLGSLD
ncbi:hypothetical protein K456DRAFT_1829158 [Colletotrichum gloeosporioides 23]|nr:hypothetical protein K456DRAFT_1829158 [Colletotrichum gloeosporioides 23]